MIILNNLYILQKMSDLAQNLTIFHNWGGNLVELYLHLQIFCNNTTPMNIPLGIYEMYKNIYTPTI